MLLRDITKSNAYRYPNKLALVDGSTRMNWKELNERINRVANMLLSQGISKGDRVGLIAENCHQYVELLFAAAKTGIIAVCLNYRFSSEQLSRMLNIATPKAIVVQGQFKETVESIRSEVPSIEKFIGLSKGHGYAMDFDALSDGSPAEEPSADLNEDDGYAICFSSGTTGEPKAALISHRNRITNCIQVGLSHGVTRDNVFLISMALYAGVSQQWIFSYAFTGATVVIMNFAPEAFIKAIENEKVDTILINHTFYTLIKEYLDKNKQTFDFSSVKLIRSAGQALSYEQWQEVQKFFNNSFVVKGMAMTEAGGVITGVLEEYKTWLSPEATEEEKRKFNTLGKPMIGTEIKIMDDNDNELPPGEIGELIVRGGNVVKTFWNQPYFTESVLRGGWLHTGDLAMIDDEGYIYLMGRRDDRIRTGGYNVYPIEIERVMTLHPAVVEPAVLGITDEKWGEMIIAAVILKEGASVSEEEMKEHCRKHLAGFQVPKRIFFLKEFPRHPVWKRVVKKELAQKLTEIINSKPN
ncbi:MAG TPA: AMP-binding protein [Syntrophorhabdaceae bacterium]|nr:AMP-binding protein [Syntrophorhabdaceae bacterium]